MGRQWTWWIGDNWFLILSWTIPWMEKEDGCTWQDFPRWTWTLTLCDTGSQILPNRLREKSTSADQLRGNRPAVPYSLQKGQVDSSGSSIRLPVEGWEGKIESVCICEFLAELDRAWKSLIMGIYCYEMAIKREETTFILTPKMFPLMHGIPSVFASPPDQTPS